MNPAKVRAELEEEWTWRSDEVRFLHNQLGNLVSQTDRDRFRRSLIVMLYAHFEGFCKVAFTIYVDAINGENLTVADGTPILGAAALVEVFVALANTDKKNDVFRRTLPTEEKLHTLARRADFIEQFNEFEQLPLRIDAETVVSTESNLKPAVLKKLLFSVGLDPNLASAWDGNLHRLLNKRNGIAHGSERSGITSAAYGELELAVNEIVRRLILTIYRATLDDCHLKTA